MAMKPTYEALEQWVKELEEKALEHKQAEANLQRHVAELERANQELKQFVYVMSRDLEEPLEIVMTYLRFVEARYKDRLDWDAKEFIASAVDGANRMQRLIAELLAYLTTKDPGGAVKDGLLSTPHGGLSR